MKEKIVLAYSGGLDTSIILKWLINKGYEVICFVADVGQGDDFEAVKQKALSLGAAKVVVDDLKQAFVEEYIFEALLANALYEGKYLLGTAIARPLIAKRLIDCALVEGTTSIAHGCTGKGNDQVRFELAAYQLLPNVNIIAPWRERDFLAAFTGRTSMLTYAQKENIPVTSTHAKPYSMDANLMHTSYEGGSLEAPEKPSSVGSLDPETASDTPTFIEIRFEKGIPVSVTNLTTKKHVEGALPLFLYLNELGALHGIGRIDIVESRFIGIKSRGVYESPGATILWAAHHDLEMSTLDREVLFQKAMMAIKIGQLIYNGLWFSPEKAFLMAAVKQSQENVDGCVTLKLYKGSATPIARASEKSLFNSTLASMDESMSFDQQDATGFIKIHSLRLKQPLENSIEMSVVS